MAASALTLAGVDAFYGDGHVLHGVSFAVGAGRLLGLGSIWTTPGFTDEVIHLFAAFELTEVPARHDEDEVIELVEMPLERALELVWSGELRDAKSALALLQAAHHVGALR